MASLKEHMSGPVAVTSGRDRYRERLIAEGSALALPELRHAEALYRVEDRHGLTTVAVAEPALAPRQRDALARFRFAQGLAAGLIDEHAAWHQRVEATPPAAYASPETV